MPDLPGPNMVFVESNLLSLLHIYFPLKLSNHLDRATFKPINMDVQYSKLQNLPPELLGMIFENLRRSPYSLRSLALTCWRFCDLATPLLYSSICLKNPARSEQLARTMQNVRLSSLVLELQIHFHDTQMDPIHETLLHAICLMYNLEKLSVRSAPLKDVMETANDTLMKHLMQMKYSIGLEPPHLPYVGERLRSRKS
jgi:hypothetical protein